ncbi:MAG: exodeoxyribonuclease VII large subunit [Lachnospiraceae bacterium]|nr:exodeoxyribonuclease VII large subunit [Lachnospiraceae bacterium]MDE6981220.1 exodeoxyribonuclease VII large subunit [Lachnospiraceae bacterium]
MKRSTYSVTQVNGYIKNMFAQDFMLKNICVKGEISNCKYHSSGHIYFTLKDEKAAISGVMFAGNRSGLKFHLQEGDMVVITGSVEVYERDGRYQLYAREITKDGAGDLFLRFEALKQELLEMGMFAPEYKKPIPRYIKTLGVVTAETGAAVQDIRNISNRRNPYVQVILYPAQVQGQGAAQSIVKGIQALEHYGVDVMIVGRGGGSIEDLWAFNEEIVARAIFDCTVPVISAVGHETDFTIADFVADLRAPTPSAGAELAVYDIFELQNRIGGLWQELHHAMENQWNLCVSHYQSLLGKLQQKSPLAQLNGKKQYALNLEERLGQRMEGRIADSKYQLGLLAGRLEGLSPAKKLNQGLAFVSDTENKRISKASQIRPGDMFCLRFADGTVRAKAEDVLITEKE